MQLISSIGATAKQSRNACRPLAVGLALAAVIIPAGWATGNVSAVEQEPDGVVGDPHSAEVARLAGIALDANEAAERTGKPADVDRYGEALADTAAATARELGVTEQSVQQAWDRADDVHQVAVLSALTQLGVEYQSNTSEEGVGFDCSGLTLFAWSEAGVALSRPSGAQISEAAERNPDSAMAGDLVQYPGHVMMYLGVPDAVVHASNPDNDVELWVLSDRSVRYGDPTGTSSG